MGIFPNTSLDTNAAYISGAVEGRHAEEKKAV
jgi:hypothetical protein